jgi:hypothetical protein
VIDPLKGWNNSNIGEQPKEINITYIKKFRADGTYGMLAIIQCRIVLSYSLLSKNIKIKIYRIIILSGLLWV